MFEDYSLRTAVLKVMSLQVALEREQSLGFAWSLQTSWYLGAERELGVGEGVSGFSGAVSVC